MVTTVRLLIHIIAVVVLLGSGSLLVVFARVRARGRREMAEHGIHDPIPLPPAAWLIVAAWVLAFSGAIAVLILA